MTRVDEKTIYLDNAATSYPKPEPVYRAADQYLRHAANPGRGGHRMAMTCAQEIFSVRLKAAEFLGTKHPERLIFTPGCTHSINWCLKGLGLSTGDAVVVSAMEHNAVMRPLRQLEYEEGVELRQLPYCPEKTVNEEELERAVRDSAVKLFVLCHASNVTGEVVDLEYISQTCKKHGVLLLVDAAQSAGVLNADIDEQGIDIWCASGHKGLMGAQGVGLLFLAPHVGVSPLIAGGTGSASETQKMPDAYPDHLEAGTLPGPAILSLGAGIDWIKSVGMKKIREHEIALAESFVGWALSNERVFLKGRVARGEGPQTGVVSFGVDGMSPSAVADALDREWNIATRPGLHCAAAAHRSLGTIGAGLVRISFGYFNSDDDLKILIEALEYITRRDA